MSFFRNIRSSISRGKSSSRDTTPTPTHKSNSRPSSMVSSSTATTANTVIPSGRRDSNDSRTDSLFNRSDTFILNSDDEESRHSSNNSKNSSLEQKKKTKSKVLSKFSTFTKRKKTPSPEQEAISEHHPSENATNTYYKWKSDGNATLDYDAQTDPFNFLYEQHSNLKTLQNGNTESSSRTADLSRYSGGTSGGIDYSTYRKGKAPFYLREHIAQLKTPPKTDLRELKGETPESAAEKDQIATQDSEKYKTVTLNSFRKSFRDKFLQQPDVPHNPAWFVEVDTPPKTPESRARRASKENRPDFLVFDNDNYRPTSRSPLRNNERNASDRSHTRSPVKRNETFRIERNEQESHTSPSIRIEIKNSITPHMPGRLLPVGVAKPMLSTYNNNSNNNNQHHENSRIVETKETHKTSNKFSQPTQSFRDKSPLRNWAKPITVSPVRHNKSTNGRYQTLVQIRNEANAKQTSPANQQHSSNIPVQRNRLLSTRIQLGAVSPTVQKRLTTAGARYSLATTTPVTAAIAPSGRHQQLTSYELLKQHSNTPTSSKLTHQTPLHSKTPYTNPTSTPGNITKHTYFGDAPLASAQHAQHNNKSSGQVRTYGYSPMSGLSAYATPASKLQQQQQQQPRTAATTHNRGYESARPQNQQQQKSYLVSTQRRSRSPIKMPWR